MKKKILILLGAFFLVGCGQIERNLQGTFYDSIYGETGTLITHLYSGDVEYKNVKIKYIDEKYNVLMYTKDGDEKTYYYSGALTFIY